MYRTYAAVTARDRTAATRRLDTPISDELAEGTHRVRLQRVIPGRAAGRMGLLFADRYASTHLAWTDLFPSPPDQAGEYVIHLAYGPGFRVVRGTGDKFFVQDALLCELFDEGPWDSYSEAREAALASGMRESRLVLQDMRRPEEGT